MENTKRFWRRQPKSRIGNGKLSVEQAEESKQTSGFVDSSETWSTDLEVNHKRLKHIFSDCSDVIYREITFDNPNTKGLLIYTEGIVASEDVYYHILHPLMHRYIADMNLAMTAQNPDVLSNPEHLEASRVPLTQAKREGSVGKTVEAILNSSAAFLVDGYAEALTFNVKGGSRRSVSEPVTEAVVRGPREGFTESLRVNTALLRFKVKSPDLKTVSFTVGERTKTSVVLTYIEGLADPEVIDEAKRRIESIKIDGILESAYIEELIEDNPYSPFPQIQNSERPDTVASNLLEGRFAIFIDGTPFVLVAPITAWHMLQANEDYYERYFISNLLRWLRMIFLFVALYLPGLYIAVITYHQDMLPTTLILSIASSRESIPFPALVEVLIMEVAFEALSEAGIRLPKTVGQSVSILGALVIGQSAVEAGIVSAPMVIVVSITGIALFTIPRFNFAISVRMLRFPMFILAGLFGLFGLVVGTVWLLAHLCHLRSFGVPYLAGVAPYHKSDKKDVFIRAPWWKMISRPASTSRSWDQRMGKDMKPTPEARENW
jgi:spore germination protein